MKWIMVVMISISVIVFCINGKEAVAFVQRIEAFVEYSNEEAGEYGGPDAWDGALSLGLLGLAILLTLNAIGMEFNSWKSRRRLSRR